MGDTNDGSSRAAQSAQPSEEETRGEEQQREAPTGAIGFLNRILGFDTPETAAPAPSTAEERRRHADTRAEQAGHQAMMLNLRNMRDVRVEDVAVPRADIVSVPDTSTVDELVDVFRESTYSRLPVYTDTLDQPVGFLHLKDFALKHGFNGTSDSFDISASVRPLLYVPPSMPIGVLLQKMQTERIHMALVIDEYGGVDGLVTIEDLVEQIVGDIADEHDTKEAVPWKEEAPGVYLCAARAPLADFEEVAGVDLLADELDEDVESLGGLVFMLAGRVPLRGEVIPHPQGHEFEVVDADPRMVKRVRVRLQVGVGLDRAAE